MRSIVELMDYEGTSHEMMGIPNTRNDLDLKGSQGKSCVSLVNSLMNLNIWIMKGKIIYFPICTMMVLNILALNRVI